MEESAPTGDQPATEAPTDKLEGSPVSPPKAGDKLEEDVPEDFFDDFLKEDFMAGLDIVDEDNEQEGLKKLQETHEESATGKEKKKKIDHVKQFKISEPGVKGQKIKLNMKGQELRVERQELERLDQELEQMRQEKFRRSSIDDIRRDPEKTRQAIQKDKIKSAKDKEKKLITDIVETGLVPPGMELEMDIDSQAEVITDLREKIRGGKREKTPERSIKRKLSRKSSIKRSKSKSSTRSDDLLSKSKVIRRSPRKERRSPLLRRSPRRLSPRLRRSPLYRRSPIRLSRSPRRRRLRRSSTRSPRRRSKSRSPSYRRYRKSPSPRRRRRSRSTSPRPRREEKKSFLEELVAKLNESHPSTPAVINPTFASAFIPQQQMMMPQTVFFNQGYMEPIPPIPPIVQPRPPLLPPIQTPQPPAPLPKPKEDLYDESFFIGNDVLSQVKRQPTPPSAKSTQKNGVGNVDRNATKLYEDKKINLSDFLSLTAKPQVSSTSSTKLQEKVKVIQRCQDAIKLLTERRSAGPLIVHKINAYQPPKDKTTSPLLRAPPIRLPFTTPGVRSETDTNFKRCCEILLYKVGIEKNLSTGEAPKRSLVVPPKDVVAAFSNPSSSELFPAAQLAQSRTFGTQTDKDLIRCNECLRRKGILYAQVGVQTGKEMSVNFSVSTQVTEADFYSMIPKTQSLASLTPAQLLGKSMVPDQKVNMDQLRASINRINSQTKYVPSTPPPPQMNFQNPPMPEPSYPSPLFGQQLFAPNVPARPQYNQRRGGYNNINNNKRF